VTSCPRCVQQLFASRGRRNSGRCGSRNDRYTGCHGGSHQDATKPTRYTNNATLTLGGFPFWEHATHQINVFVFFLYQRKPINKTHSLIIIICTFILQECRTVTGQVLKTKGNCMLSFNLAVWVNNTKNSAFVICLIEIIFAFLHKGRIRRTKTQTRCMKAYSS